MKESKWYLASKSLQRSKYIATENSAANLTRNKLHMHVCKKTIVLLGLCGGKDLEPVSGDSEFENRFIIHFNPAESAEDNFEEKDPSKM
jgi:hypothetical protein